MASFADLLGVTLNAAQGIDSRNMLKAFLGEDGKGLPYMLEEARTVAIRQGDWKYVPGSKKGKSQLYNLKSDIGEQTNVADKHPDKVKELDELLKECKADTNGLRNE